MTKDEALKIALEALEVANSCVDGYYIPKGKTQLPEVEEAITAIKEALAQPEQEPVAWLHRQGNFTEASMNPLHDDEIDRGWTQEPLYTTPPQRTWVGLTSEEIETIWRKVEASDFYDCVLPFAEKLEARLKEKNNG